MSMLSSRRHFNLSIAASTAVLLLPEQVTATTVRALSLGELIEFSDRATLGTPIHYSCEWTYVGGSRRIVTWTRVAQEENLYEESAREDEILVMTLGGKVGNLRQKVPGEAALTMGQRCLVFASPEAADGSRRVIGMGQGKYSIEKGERLDVVRASRDLPHLIHSQKNGQTGPSSALETLSGKSLDEARNLLRGRK